MIKVKRFTASWCSPCRALVPLMEEIKSETPDVIYEVIDIDENSDDAMKYGIRSIPAVIVEEDGIEKSRLIGLRTKESYLNAIRGENV